MGVPVIGQSDAPSPQSAATFRLLYCLVCDSLEELPPFEGRPENDHLLEIAAKAHAFPSGDPHQGKLFVMPLAYWQGETKKTIISQIKGGGSKGLDEFDDTYYASRSTFAEDALKCFDQHLRPKDGCSDYESPSKRLLPNTADERRDLGLPSPANAPGPKNYLCQFCPVHSVVTTRKRALMGAYNN